MITQEQITKRSLGIGAMIPIEFYELIARLELEVEELKIRDIEIGTPLGPEMQQGKGGMTFEEHMKLRYPGIDPAGFIYEVAQAAWNAAKSSK